MPIFWHYPFFLNLFLQGMAVFATPSWPSLISGLPHFPVRYLGERCASTIAKTKYLLFNINLPIKIRRNKTIGADITYWKS